MLPKTNNLLDQFENEHTRIAAWVEYELHLTQFLHPFYFYGPENLNIPLVVAHADQMYVTFPTSMSILQKFVLTLQSVETFIKERY